MKLVLKFSGKILILIKVLFSNQWNCGKRTKLAFVHGGGPQISKFIEKWEKPSFVQGLRVTDQEDMDLTEMVLSGLLNKALVGMLSQYGVAACGISGRDANLFIAKNISLIVKIN